MTPVLVMDGDWIFKLGAVGQEMFVLQHGVVRLLPAAAVEHGDEALKLPYLDKLEHKGILTPNALLQPRVHKYSALAETRCELLALTG